MTGLSEEQAIPNQPGCWYRIEVYECPLCGRGEENRTRQPPPRPEDPSQRYRFEHRWDYCGL